MKKIVGILRPFELKQEFFVYEDGNKIDMASYSIDEIYEGIFSLFEKHGANKVYLYGPNQYSKGIKRKIREKEIQKYNKESLEIELV